MKILSDVEHLVPDIEIIGVIQLNPEFFKVLQIEKLDGFVLNFQIKSNTLKIKNTFQFTYKIDLDTHLIEMKTTRNENQLLDFIVSVNMISKRLKANLTLNQENIFAMNVLLGTVSKKYGTFHVRGVGKGAHFTYFLFYFYFTI